MCCVGLGFKSLAPIIVPVTDEQIKLMPSAKSQLSERINSNAFYRPVVMFPEGCTTQSRSLMKFKNGAFEGMTTIQPVLLKYKYLRMDPSWTNDVSPEWLVFRLCSQFVNTLNVTYLNPVSPDINSTPNDFNKKVRNIFLTHGVLEESCFTSRDNVFFKKFHKSKIDYICNKIFFGNKNISTYCIESGLNQKQIANLVKKFIQYDSDKDGFLNRSEFSKLINEQTLINLLINNKSEHVSFEDVMTKLFNTSEIYDFSKFYCMMNTFKNISNRFEFRTKIISLLCE